ncbi:hypothetical protein NMY22_g19845 [Coprinellus aureogranulatus]|nr:hypothetical protein NMY22_g19845 [Coprinellus aureogranulatus]
MQNTHFTVAGMSSSTSTHHTPNLNAWGTASTSAPFGDSLSQSRSHYQSGYLISATQNTNSPQGNPRVDEAPVVQTKAKLNQVLTRGTASDFGMESMFQSTSRQRQALADEDAPPMSSPCGKGATSSPNGFNWEALGFEEIENQPGAGCGSFRCFTLAVAFVTRDFTPVESVMSHSKAEVMALLCQSTLDASRFGKRHTQAPPVNNNTEQPIYIIVFGYPADKFTVTVEYFKRSGASTDADPSTEILNCFRIGYNDPATALRAVRKNGEVLESSFMIGVKWAPKPTLYSAKTHHGHSPETEKQ